MGSVKKKGQLGGSFMFNLILFGFMGQIAWNVENMYFNTFLYNSVYSGATQNAVDGSINVIDAVSKMIALSAVTAVLTTFIMGTLTDRIGKRTKFISIGYILWGLITGSFGLINRSNTAALFRMSDEVKILTVTVWIVIAMDCIMTFIGSTANDASFNAWITDSTNFSNRATTESILAILPIAAMVVVLGLGGALLAGDDKNKSYAVFFIVLGAIVTLCGIIGLFTLKEAPVTSRSTEGGYFGDLLYSLRPSTVKNNAKLYLTLAAICIYSVAMQIFIPYLIIYLEHSPDKFFDLGNISITPALIAVAVGGIIVAVAAIIGSGKLIDRYGKDKFIIPLILILTVGLFVVGRAHDLTMLIIGVVPTAIGYCMMGIMLNAAVRDFTPEGKAGLFQGVRMIATVLIPMVAGPFIGKNAIISSGATYIDEYGTAQSVPTSAMFTYAGIVCAVTLIPLVVILFKGGFSVKEPVINDTLSEKTEEN